MSVTYKEKYKARFPLHFNPLDIELYCFRTKRTVEQGGLGRAEHFWKIVELLYSPKNPVRNRSKFFIRNAWSESIIDELCVHRYVALGGCASSTKSETVALWILINFLADARNTLCAILSTSLKESRKRAWGSLLDFIRVIPPPGLPLKVIDSIGIVRFVSTKYTSSDKSSISLVAADRKVEKEATEKLIGFHNQNVIVFADELSELTDAVLEYALPGGNLSSNPSYQFIGAANPPGYYDPFAKLWKPKAGWTSITVNDTKWESEYGVSLHFDATQSPAITDPDSQFGINGVPFLPTAEKVEQAKAAEGGENSIRFWRMIRGFPCPMGQEDLIYSEQDIVKWRGDIPAIWGSAPLLRVAALDPSFTNGGDRSMVYLGTVGVNTDGVRVINLDRYVELVEDVTNKVDNRTMQIARAFRDLCVREGVQPQHAAVDSTGAGDPFCDVLDIIWSRNVLRVRFGGKASELPVSLTDLRPANERYYNRVTELWYSAKELLRQGQLKGISPAMAKEMTVRKYGTTGAEKRLYAEPKADMKVRTGFSPDLAEAGFILVELCRQRLGFATHMTTLQQQEFITRGTPWRETVRRLSSFRRMMPMNLPYAGTGKLR
jgi:hypothetical protein